MNYTINAAALSRAHLGSLVQVSKGDLRITDMLRGVSHEADLVEERRIFEEVPSFILGRTETVLTFANAGAVQVNGNSDVVVMDQK